MQITLERKYRFSGPTYVHALSEYCGESITFDLRTFKMDNLTGYYLTIISHPLQAGIAHFVLTKYFCCREEPPPPPPPLNSQLWPKVPTSQAAQGT